MNIEGNSVSGKLNKPKFKITAQHWQGAATMLLVCAIAFALFTFLPNADLYGAAYPFNPRNVPGGLIESGWYEMISVKHSPSRVFAEFGNNRDSLLILTRGGNGAKFYFEHLGNNEYRILAGSTYDPDRKNKFIEVKGADMGILQPLQLYTSDDPPPAHKIWIPISDGNGNFYFKSRNSRYEAHYMNTEYYRNEHANRLNQHTHRKAFMLIATDPPR
ncbi:MAG: RICIN domain-containing protein [Oscillospiraceae bacterium]|nr:RICIN domain-containing protein [Oscillospiraceae bacterium]MCL2279397.1 RICIN domain-containing protein [Oscillospiraceae bacterium]